MGPTASCIDPFGFAQGGLFAAKCAALDDNLISLGHSEDDDAVNLFGLGHGEFQNHSVGILGEVCFCAV